MVEQTNLAELVTRAQRGDRSAFEDLVDHFRSRLESVIHHQVGDSLKRRATPDDVLQETLVRAFESIHRLQFRGEQALFRWLSAIARHVVLEHASKEKRERLAPLCDDLIASCPTQSKAHRRQERFDRLQSALDELSPDQQNVVYLARVERVPVKEIAQQMGRTPNSVSHLLLRALQSLRERFGDTESLGLPDIPLRRPEGDGDE